MTKRTIILSALGAFALVAVVTILTAASAAAPVLPGITAKDELPNGCVDCHQNAGAGKDYRLNVGIPANLKGHPDISKLVKTVPNDCAMCHKEGQKAGALNLVLHTVHYAKPAENPFVTAYQGACLNCHALGATGAITVKSAPRNW
jgi:hypothetical protein